MNSNKVDNPEAYIARDRRAALAAGVELADRVCGSALFADISGFTPLTEALRNELGPQRGAEELTAQLDQVFHAVISELDCHGGNVIYFAGDAITGWIDADDGRRAVASALAMQTTMSEVGRIVTPGGTQIQLGMKVAVAVGTARRSVVGDPDIQRIDVLAGRLLDDLANAEHYAEKGEVLIDQSAMESLGNRVTLSAQRTDPRSGRRYGVASALSSPVSRLTSEEPPPLDRSIVRQWLLPAVYERITMGRGEFLAELRPAYPVFLRFSGLDFDADQAAIAKLDDFVVRAQRAFAAYGGNVLQLTLGDKGAYLYGVFGSPIAHEDDAARAASAALELAALDRDTAVGGIQIGIAYGPLRSGTYGHAMRRTFVCLGDAVNLAARLMAAAPAGRIYVSDEVRAAAGDAFVWESLEPLRLKGKARPVAASVLSSSLARIARRRTRYLLPLVGRGTEIGILNKALEGAIGGSGRIVAISAEAGLGKSRLVAEFVREARRRGILVAFGECQSYGINTSYFVWREIWRRLLTIEEDAPSEVQREAAHTALRRIDPALVPRAPLLSEVIGVSIPDTELTQNFDAKLRKASLEDLLVACLCDRATGEPVVLVLEDCHWIDSLSKDLLEMLVRAVSGHRVLVVLAYRPATEPGGALGLERLPQFAEIELSELGAEESGALIAAKASQLFGVDSPPRTLVDMIVTRSQGNPFYAEELLNFIASQDVQPTDMQAIRALDLPDSLHSLVLSRIDALSENPRRTLKIASVFGRVFRAASLPGAYPELGSIDQVREPLDELQSKELLTLDEAETLSYLFRHVVTREVAYNSLPFSFRGELHRRVGDYIERSEAVDLEPHLDLLAHHYWHGDDDDKKRAYLTRAEESARRRYANAAAIDYCQRLATLHTGPARAEVLLRLGKVLELTGAWPRAEAVEQEAHDIATAAGELGLVARCEAALAEVERKQGRYAESTQRLHAAATAFRELGDDEGLGLTLHLSGTVSAQQGEYAAARQAYQDSLVIRRRLGDQSALAALHSNLAIIAEYEGDYAAAHAANEQALKIRSEIGDRWAIGVSQNNLGMIALHQGKFAEALSRFEETLRLNREVGDAWMVAISHNNLGNACRGLGDIESARAQYAEGLEDYQVTDDHWGLAFLFEDIAILAIQCNDYLAGCEFLGAAQSLREEIGSPRSPSLEADLDQQLARARQAAGDAAADNALTQGHDRPVSDSIDAALQYLR